MRIEKNELRDWLNQNNGCIVPLIIQIDKIGNVWLIARRREAGAKPFELSINLCTREEIEFET